MCGGDSGARGVKEQVDAATDGGTRQEGGSGGSTQTGGDAGEPDASAGGDGGADASTDGGRAVDGGETLDGGSSPDATADQRAPVAWHLWVMEARTSQLFGYAPDQLTTTNGDAPDIAITLSDNLKAIHSTPRGTSGAP